MFRTISFLLLQVLLSAKTNVIATMSWSRSVIFKNIVAKIRITNLALETKIKLNFGIWF